MNLNYPGRVSTTDVVGRVMGPDQYGGFVVATEAKFQPEHDRTRVAFRPLTPAEMQQVVVDGFGQHWLGEIGGSR